jgi:predicted dehydrogenase
LLQDEEIEVVYVPLPTGLHEEWIIKALEHGKHVVAEKSLALNYRSAKRMADVAEARNLLLLENYCFRFHSQLEFIRNRLSDPCFGEVRLLRSSFGFPPLAKGNFRYDRALGGGVLMDAAGYPLKLAQILLSGSLNVTAAQLVRDRATGVDIYGNATLVDARGQTAQIAFGFDNFYQCSMEVWGSKGRVSTGRIFTAPPSLSPSICVEHDGVTSEYRLRPDNQFLRLVEHVCATIRSGSFQEARSEALHQARLIEELRTIAEQS